MNKKDRDIHYMHCHRRCETLHQIDPFSVHLIFKSVGVMQTYQFQISRPICY